MPPMKFLAQMAGKEEISDEQRRNKEASHDQFSASPFEISDESGCNCSRDESADEHKPSKRDEAK
jgi:hypothetical protein